MYEKLVDFVSKQLDLDPAKITPDSTFASLGIDSLDTVELLMNLEDEIGIEIELSQKVTTVADLDQFIQSQAKG